MPFISLKSVNFDFLCNRSQLNVLCEAEKLLKFVIGNEWHKSSQVFIAILRTFSLNGKKLIGVWLKWFMKAMLLWRLWLFGTKTGEHSMFHQTLTVIWIERQLACIFCAHRQLLNINEIATLSDGRWTNKRYQYVKKPVTTFPVHKNPGFDFHESHAGRESIKIRL